MVKIGRELLQQVSVLGALSTETLDFLLSRAVRVRRSKGEFFFREGDPAQSMYIVEYGRVAILKYWQGQPYLINDLGVGQCFGEMALMDMHPRSAAVQALEDSGVVKIGAADLLALYQQDVEQFTLLQMNLGREVSRRLRDANDFIFRTRIGVTADSAAAAYPKFDVPLSDITHQ